MTKIDPALAAGFRDYPPKEMIPRQRMLDQLRRVCELFGALPLDTSIVERYEILTGGEPTSKQIFRIDSRSGDEDDRSGLALRFDLTVSLARFVASNPDLPRPFRRFQTGYVFRGENPQAGRYRGFTQFDLDIVGSADPMSDAEVISWMNTAMSALGVPNYRIKVNSRKILNGLAAYAGFNESSTPDVLRSIDKMDKVGWKGVSEELVKSGLDDKVIEAIRQFVELRSGTPRETLEAVKSLMSNSPAAQEGVADLTAIADCLEALRVPESVWTIDLSVARGLGYYTGTVFETTVAGKENLGSVLSGGRYDDLVTRFGGGNMPAVGASVGVDRLFELLKQLNLITFEQTVASTAILNFEPEARARVQEVASILREAGVATEIFMGKEATLKGQLSDVVSRDFKVAVMIGKKELEAGLVTVRDLRTKSQQQVPLDEVAATVSKMT